MIRRGRREDEEGLSFDGRGGTSVGEEEARGGARMRMLDYDLLQEGGMSSWRCGHQRPVCEPWRRTRALGRFGERDSKRSVQCGPTLSLHAHLVCHFRSVQNNRRGGHCAEGAFGGERTYIQDSLFSHNGHIMPRVCTEATSARRLRRARARVQRFGEAKEALCAQSSACAPRSVWIRALPSAEPGSSGTCINL